MKATTCVRVVLPTDELVRMEYTATMTVADLVSALEKRISFQKSNGVKRNGGRDYVACGDNNSDTDPATELNLGWYSTESIPKLSRGQLTLVRMESELKAGSLVVDEVENLDILEFQIVSSDTLEWAPEINGQQSRRRVSPIIKSPPLKIVEAVQPLSTALIPLWRVKQDRTAREELAIRQNITGVVGSLTPAVFDRHLEVKLRELIQHSKVRRSALRRRGARRHPTSRNKRRVLQFSGFQARRQYTKMRKYAERILLQAGMQLIECIQVVQKDVRKLVFLLRDAILGGNSLTADDLLSLTRMMVHALTCAGVDSTTGISAASEDTRENMVRRLSWDIAGKDGGVTILLEGWVVTAEWGTFWRSQRKEYACLCDNHTLYFFSSRTHCADFVFELGRERDGSMSETSKRLLKSSSPLSQIDLSETDWTVRKSVQEEDSGKQHRNAFAFFGPHGRMRLVLDVSTAAEATMWARLISAEISQAKLFARMCELNGAAESEEYTDNSNPLTSWMEIMTQSSTTIGEQHSLIIPLHSLYSQLDRRNGTAREERYKSWTLSQALKDLQRDRVKINGLLLAGASLEANILALTLEVLKCTDGEHDTSAKTRAGEAITAAKEMTALRFAHQVIICSSRTHGGGDILDTLHLLFGNDRFCICPDAPSMEPIEINISKSAGTEETLSAQITMKMTYRVIPTDSIGPTDNKTYYTNGNGTTDASVVGSFMQDTEVEHQETAEFKILGTYSQRLNCHFVEANDIQGSVQLQVAS